MLIKTQTSVFKTCHVFYNMLKTQKEIMVIKSQSKYQKIRLHQHKNYYQIHLNNNYKNLASLIH